MMRDAPLWQCPKCGHRFVTANMWHSCGRYRLADHFEGKDPMVRQAFDRFRELVERCGPVTVYAQKTRIVCQVRVRFAGAVVRKRWLNVALWLTRRVRHPALQRVEVIPPESQLHYFRFNHPGELDDEFAVILEEAYRVGCREHLRR